MKPLACFCLLILSLTAGRGDAQAGPPLWNAEVRTGVAFRSPPFSRSNVEDPGIGGSVRLQYRAFPSAVIYTGYELYRFRVGPVDPKLGLAVEPASSLTSHGAVAGVELRLHEASAIRPWVRTGMLSHRQLVRGTRGSTHSDWRLGFEIGGGVHLPMSKAILLTPGVRYVRHGDTSYLSPEVGLGVRL